MSNFQPLEVVDRGGETQPEVVENLNKLNLICILCNAQIKPQISYKNYNVFPSMDQRLLIASESWTICDQQTKMLKGK